MNWVSVSDDIYNFIVPILQMTKLREGNYYLLGVFFVPNIGIGTLHRASQLVPRAIHRGRIYYLFYRCRNCSSEWLSGLPKVTQLVQVFPLVCQCFGSSVNLTCFYASCWSRCFIGQSQGQRQITGEGLLGRSITLESIPESILFVQDHSISHFNWNQLLHWKLRSRASS